MDIRNPFDQLFSIKIDLCLESGAKDAVFCEFDSLFAYLLSHTDTLKSQNGIPFLHVAYRLEKFLKMLKIERNIRVQLIIFKKFEKMWARPGLILLRRLLLSHIESQKLVEEKFIHKFESFDSAEFGNYLEGVHPYLLLCSHERDERSLPQDFLVKNGWNYLHNLVITLVKSRKVFHVCPYSSLQFHASSVSGFVFTTRNPESIKYLEEKPEIIPMKMESPNMVKDIGKDCDSHCRFIMAALSLFGEKKNEMLQQILLETVMLQKLLCVEKRMIEEHKPLGEGEKVFLEAFYMNCLFLLNESEFGFDLGMLDVDFLDVRLFGMLCQRQRSGDFRPRKIEDYAEADLIFKKMKVKPKSMKKSKSKAEKKIKSPEEEEEEEEEGEEEDWMVSPSPGEESEEEEEEKEEKEKGKGKGKKEEEEIDSESLKEELWKIKHEVIDTIGASSMVGRRELSKEEQNERRHELQQFKDASHWRVPVPLEKPDKHVLKKWGWKESRLVEEYRANAGTTNIDFRRSLPSLEKINQKAQQASQSGKQTKEKKKKKEKKEEKEEKKKKKEEEENAKVVREKILRDEQSSLKSVLEMMTEKKIESRPMSRPMWISLMNQVMTEHDIDLTEELIFWRFKDLKRYEPEIKTSEAAKWKFFQTMVVIELLKEVKKKINEVSKKKDKSLAKEKKKSIIQEIIQLRSQVQLEVSNLVNTRKEMLGKLPSVMVESFLKKKMRENREEFGVEYQMENREKFESISEFKERITLTDYLNHEKFTKFKKNLGFIPDPWQLELMRCIDEKKRALVVTPTSSGKTFLSLYAMGRILENKENLVFVAPTNSLVNQVATDVLKHFMGTKRSNVLEGSDRKLLGVFTSDEKLGPISSHILVTNPQCLHILFLSTDQNHLEWKKSLKYIVFDEIHTINDIGEGSVLEKLILMAPCPFIALSATIGNSEKLELWMNAIEKKDGSKSEVIRIYNEDRPNDLKYHVFDSDKDDDYVIHPVGLLNERDTNDIDTIEENIRVLKRLTPFQSLQLYRSMKEEFKDDLKFLDDVDLNKYFGVERNIWKMIPRIPGELSEEETEGEDEDNLGFLNVYEKSLKEKLIQIVRKKEWFEKYRNIVLKCRGDLFDYTSPSRSLRKALPGMVTLMDRKQLFPALFFHLSRVGIQKLAGCLGNLIKTKLDLDNFIKRKGILEKKIGENKEGVEEEEEEKVEEVKQEEEEEVEGEDEEVEEVEEEEVDGEEVEGEGVEEKGKTKIKIKKKSDEEYELEELLEELEKTKEDLKKQMKKLQVSDEVLKELMACKFLEPSRKIDEEIERIKISRRKASGERITKRHKLQNGEEEEEEEEEDLLLQSLRFSIGIHHGALDKSYRAGVERLFRGGLLKILLCTGTLSYGINAPCRSVVLLGDSPYLTPTLFNQCSGRSGRRGFDTLGTIWIYKIPRERLRRLIVHDSDKIVGHSLISPSYVMRLMVAMQYEEEDQKKEKRKREDCLSMVHQLMAMPLSCIESLDEKLQQERSKKTLSHHFRFSLEFLREIGLLNKEGNGVFLAGLASHLFHTEPSNFLLVHFLRRLVLHKFWKKPEEGNQKKPSDEEKKQIKKRIFGVLCHLFTDVEVMRSADPKKKDLVLEPLEEGIMKEVTIFSDLVGNTFKKFLRTLRRETKKEEEEEREEEEEEEKVLTRNMLPLSGLEIGNRVGELDNKLQNELLARYKRMIDEKNLKINDLVLFNIFEGLSGNTDEKLDGMKIKNILDCLSDFFDHSLFPIPFEMLAEKDIVGVSSFVYKFFTDPTVKMSDLAAMYGMIPQLIDWNMALFRKKLQKVNMSLKESRKNEKEWFAGLVDEINTEFNNKFFNNVGSRRFKRKWRSRRGNKSQRKQMEKDGRKKGGKRRPKGNKDLKEDYQRKSREEED